MKILDKIRYTPKPKPKAFASTGNPFYHTPAWRKVRRYYIKMNPYCVQCEGAGQVVDHINPINPVDGFDAKGYGEPLSHHNLQTLCHKCHNTKSAKQRWSK